MTAVWAYYRRIYEEWGEGEGRWVWGRREKGGEKKRRNKESVRKPR